MKTFHSNSPQRGFTLIELMIAMLIGVFLMGGVIQIFLSAKQAYRLQENLSRLQENGRFAMDFITKDVRMAGYTGCTKTLPATNPANTITEQTKLNGSNNVTNANWMASSCGSLCITATDAITFQYAKSCGGSLTTKMTGSAVGFSIKIGANSCNITVGSPVLVGDCTSSNVFTAAANTTNTKDANNNTTASDVKIDKAFLTAKDYDVDAELFAFQNNATYFIRTGAGGLPALFRVDSSGTNELVEGIENMQILYGVDTDTPNQDFIPNYYVDATAVANIKIPATGTLGTIATNDSKGAAINPPPSSWSRVVSVRINLLAVTPDNNLTDTQQPFLFNGTTYATTANPIPQVCSNNGVIITTAPLDSTTPPACSSPNKLVNDLRIRRVFSTTIAVRNRLP